MGSYVPLEPGYAAPKLVFGSRREPWDMCSYFPIILRREAFFNNRVKPNTIQYWTKQLVIFTSQSSYLETRGRGWWLVVPHAAVAPAEPSKGDLMRHPPLDDHLFFLREQE